MTMNRESNVKCAGGGGRSSSRGRHRSSSSSSSCNSGSRNFLGVRHCSSATSWPVLMQIGVWLIIVNSLVVLCSCSSLSISSQNSISKNTVLGDHEEASVDTGPAASLLPVIPATTTAATTSSLSSLSRADDTTKRANHDNNNNNNSNTDTTSSEAKRKEKKGRINSNNSSDGGSYYGKDTVRINVSNNTTAPGAVEGSSSVGNGKPKTATGGSAAAGKEYWNKQQKLATALKEAKKGKYRSNVQTT